MVRDVLKVIVVIVGLAAGLYATAANAGVPTEQVRGTVDQVIAILADYTVSVFQSSMPYPVN